MNAIEGKTVLVGVCGGIAAYKTCSLVSRLVQNGATVYVAMTENATRFVSPLTFETLSRNRVIVDTFDRDFKWEVEHVSLAKKADIAIIAPATANVIAKFANGIADDFLTTTLLACKCKILIAPAMNVAMLENPATVDNINKLVSRGITMLYGESGYLACGDIGKGRMAEPDILYDSVVKCLDAKRDLAGKTVLVTSGATRTEIDPVRFLTNRSSGKTGYYIARQAARRGANVIYIKGFTDKFEIPQTWKTVSVKTTSELFDAVKDNISAADIIVMAAAPCDYDIETRPQKIKDKTLTLELKKAPDCAAWAGENKGDKKLVIFAAETENGKANAIGKLKSKNADMVVYNDVSLPGAGFDVDTNIVTFITKKTQEAFPLMKKSELADILLDRIISL